MANPYYPSYEFDPTHPIYWDQKREIEFIRSTAFEAGKKAALEELSKQPPEILAELIVGYRVWVYDDGYLRSAYKSEVKWPHRKMLTRDIYDNKGIHAVKEYKTVIPLLKEYCLGCSSAPSAFNPTGQAKPDRCGVAGAVYMWGEVKEHAIGYLSEFAYPKEFYVGDDFDPLAAMQIEENYGVSVCLREELKKDRLKLAEVNDPYMAMYSSYSMGVARLQQQQQWMLVMQQKQIQAYKDMIAYKDMMMYGTSIFTNPWDLSVKKDDKTQAIVKKP
jgi:hypothetical protein